MIDDLAISIQGTGSLLNECRVPQLPSNLPASDTPLNLWGPVVTLTTILTSLAGLSLPN